MHRKHSLRTQYRVLNVILHPQTSQQFPARKTGQKLSGVRLECRALITLVKSDSSCPMSAAININYILMSSSILSVWFGHSNKHLFAMKWSQFKIYYHCVNVDEIINCIFHSTFYGVFNYWSYYAFYLHIINVHINNTGAHCFIHWRMLMATEGWIHRHSSKRRWDTLLVLMEFI